MIYSDFLKESDLWNRQRSSLHYNKFRRKTLIFSIAIALLFFLLAFVMGGGL